jgi:hypothetical protein
MKACHFVSFVAEDSIPLGCGTAALGNGLRIEMSSGFEVLTLEEMDMVLC